MNQLATLPSIYNSTNYSDYFCKAPPNYPFFCPTLRDVVTYSPDLLGQSVGLFSHAIDYAFFNPITQITKGLVSPLTAFLFYKNRERITSAIKLAYNSPLLAVWETFNTVINLPELTHNFLRNNLLSPLYEKFLSYGFYAVFLPHLSLVNFLLASKVAWVTLGYFAAKNTYVNLCLDYEKTLDDNQNPLATFENFKNGFFKHYSEPQEHEMSTDELLKRLKELQDLHESPEFQALIKALEQEEEKEKSKTTSSVHE